jgi:hypothetical protein
MWYFENHPRDGWRNFDYVMVKFADRVIEYVYKIKENRKGGNWVNGGVKEKFEKTQRKFMN